MGKQLYVTNISYQATEDDMRKLFSVAGRVANVKLLMDAVTGKSRGIGFVEMKTIQEAKEAVETLDDCLLIDRQIKVEEARPPQPKEKTFPGRDFRGAPKTERSGRGRK